MIIAPILRIYLPDDSIFVCAQCTLHLFSSVLSYLPCMYGLLQSLFSSTILHISWLLCTWFFLVFCPIPPSNRYMSSCGPCDFCLPFPVRLLRGSWIRATALSGAENQSECSIRVLGAEGRLFQGKGLWPKESTIIVRCGFHVRKPLCVSLSMRSLNKSEILYHVVWSKCNAMDLSPYYNTKL